MQPSTGQMENSSGPLALHRFTVQRDPVGYIDCLNLYQYVGGAPLVFVDPYGDTLAEAFLWITVDRTRLAITYRMLLAHNVAIPISSGRTLKPRSLWTWRTVRSASHVDIAFA